MTFGKIMRFKLVLFGNPGVGKTSLVERYINDKFEEDYITTLGYNVYEKEINHENNQIFLMVYDIGGQDRFKDLRKKYAQGANLAFIVYDIADRDSFDRVAEWKADLDEMVGGIPFILIGNKVDLNDERQVSATEAMNLGSTLGALDFFETSAKSGNGVENAFHQLAIKAFTIATL